MSNSVLKRILAGSSALMAVAVMDAAALQTAQAQERESRLDSLEEILVTSRRRSETLQDVPIAVQAFNAAAIERAGIERPEDFLQLTPNVHFIQTTNVGETQVHIRGVIQPRDSEPPFA